MRTSCDLPRGRGVQRSPDRQAARDLPCFGADPPFWPVPTPRLPVAVRDQANRSLARLGVILFQCQDTCCLPVAKAAAGPRASGAAGLGGVPAAAWRVALVWPPGWRVANGGAIAHKGGANGDNEGVARCPTSQPTARRSSRPPNRSCCRFTASRAGFPCIASIASGGTTPRMPGKWATIRTGNRRSFSRRTRTTCCTASARCPTRRRQPICITRSSWWSRWPRAGAIFQRHARSIVSTAMPLGST